MATLTALSIPQWINEATSGKLRSALQALFAKASVDILAVEAAATTLAARVTVIEPAVVNCTAATLTVTAALHANKVVTLNRAGGMTVTLPAAAGTGNIYRFFVGTTFTSSGIIVVPAASTAIMQGVVSISTDIGGVTMLASATADTITMNGSTTGGLKGSFIQLVDAATDLWWVSGGLVSTGSEADPFSATV